MEGPNGFYSEGDLERPLKKFQQKHNLKVDARVEPGGPTLCALSGPSVENNEHGGTSRQVAQNNSGAPSSRVGKDRQTQNPAIPKSVPVPDYRRAVFKGERLREWQNWSGAVGRLPGATSREWRAYHEIYAGEGGMKLDPGSGAFAGIHPDTLKEFIGKGNFTGVKEDTQPKDLSIEQIAQFYRDYSDAALRDIGGRAALEKFPDAEIASAFLDALFRFGAWGGAGKIIRPAIRRVEPDAVTAEGPKILKPEDLAAFLALAKSPDTRRALLDSLSLQRDIVAKNERARNEHFRFR